jgi:predicted dehydrogenase
VRALIVGLGAIGQRHARNLRALLPGVELFAWRQRWRAGLINERLEFVPGDIERDLGIKAFHDLDSALAVKPSIAVICTPTSQHAAIAHRVAMAGCHLFIEKPVSHTMDGLARLQGLVNEQRLIAAVGCQWRFHPCVERLRSLIRDGSLGKVHRAEIDFSEYLPHWHPYENFKESYAARSELGGGVVLTQIHDYDLAWWLFGEARTVMAMGGTQGSLDIDVEDTVQAQVDCERAPVVVRQSFAEVKNHRRISVHAERGVVNCDLVAGALTSTVPGVAPIELKEFDRNAMFRSVMEDFLHGVNTGAAPRAPLSEGITVLRIALAVKESMRRRVPMAVR